MSNIKVFARLKPCENIAHELFKREDQALYILSHGQVGTNAEKGSGVFEDSPSNWLRFRFAHVFETDSSQKKVFEVAARDIVNAFLEGYNGTIFVYGQTGAGKTFTMQGAHEDLADSCCMSENLGLVPQSLSLIFRRILRFQQESVDLHVSFLEIYNEKAYDLLGPLLFRGSKKTRKLQKVLVTMGGNGPCHLHGLSCHHITSEKEAVSLYCLGMMNHKVVATEAPVDQRSSRSHMVFTIGLSRQRNGAEIFFRSKLHLVDLAGSEQARKSTPMEKLQLREANFFNSSLHHLESIIIALQEFNVTDVRCSNRQAAKTLHYSSSAVLSRTKNKGTMEARNVLLKSSSAVELGSSKRSQVSVANDTELFHTPYSNSILTMLLQDSLGGNCNAAMIAVLSLEQKDLCETISTCRFAQKVAQVKNKPIQNEVIDKDAVIKRLQTTLGKLYLELTSCKKAERETTVKHSRHNGLPHRVGHCTPDAWSVCGRCFSTSHQFLLESNLDSSDDKDSGLRSNSETTSPNASEEENDRVQFGGLSFAVVRDYSFRQHPCPQITPANGCTSEHRASVITHDSGISLNAETYDQPPERDSLGPSATAQPTRPKSSDVSTQTTPLIKSTEVEGSARNKVTVRCEGKTHEVLRLMELELELQKETLVNKSKILASRLADQRARLVVMLRQGALPDDLENEKMAELLLQKKQREVENKLFLVVKTIADLNTADRRQQSLDNRNCLHMQRKCCAEYQPPLSRAHFTEGEAHEKTPTLTCYKLKLKEDTTRQKLLACREQLRNFGFSSPVNFFQGMPLNSQSSVSSLETTLPCKKNMQDSPISSFNGKRNAVGKPSLPKGRIGVDSNATNAAVLNSRCAGSRRTLLNQEEVSRKDGSTPARRDLKTLADYIKNSRQALYRKSTFPRKVFSSSVDNSCRAKKVPQKTTWRKGVIVQKDESSSLLAKNSTRECLRLHDKSFKKAECFPTNFTACRVMRNAGGVCLETKIASDAVKLTPISSPPKTTCGARGENKIQNSLSLLTGLQRQHTQRVRRIREVVNAAVVIQRSWRLYKRRRKGDEISQSF